MTDPEENLAAAATGHAAASDVLIRLDGLSKNFGQLQVLDAVSLSISPGEIHCLLGENGAGKSTLCNIIFGIHEPTSGQMWLDGRTYQPLSPADALATRVAMVHQHFSLIDDVSVVDNLLLGQARGLLNRRKCAELVADLSQRFALDLEPYARIDQLSVGERQRVEIVKCLMREPRLLVLDEPTAVLLPDEIEALLKVCERVAQTGCGIIFVTHKLAEIRRAAHRATVLRGGRVVARSEQPALDINELVRAMIARDLENAIPASRLDQRPRPARTLDPALMVDGLGVSDADGVIRVDNFTLVVEPGEIVAIAGVEGNGQSELAAVLSGMRESATGRFFVAGQELTGAGPRAVNQAGMAVVPEDRHAVGCVLAMSVAENMCLDRLHRFRRHGLFNRAAMHRHARELMERFDVRAASPEVAFSTLSGGNQQKAVLARELTLSPLRVLLAVHPTRGLDVGTVESVYAHVRMASQGGAGVLLISSELDELLGVADRIVVMYRGRIMGECAAQDGQRERIGAWMAGHA